MSLPTKLLPLLPRQWLRLLWLTPLQLTPLATWIIRKFDEKAKLESLGGVSSVAVLQYHNNEFNAVMILYLLLAVQTAAGFASFSLV